MMPANKSSLQTWMIILFASIVYFMPYKAFAASSNLPTYTSKITFKQLKNLESKAEINQTNKHVFLARYRRYRRRYRRTCGAYGCG